jgi:hypothetical protein
MAERKPPSWEEIRGLIDRADEVCQESERTRDLADHAMRQRPFWPDRRRTARPTETPGPPGKGDKPTDAG